MPDPRMRLDLQQPRNRYGARGADPAEVIAHQVHDHHVLSTVLGRVLELGALPLGLLLARRPATRALDRPGQDGPAGSAQEQLGRHAGHSAARHPDEGGVWRPQVRHRLAERVKRIAGEVGLKAEADVRLEDVAAPDVFDGPGDRGPVLGRLRHQPEVPAGVLERRRRRCAGPAAQVVEPALEGLGPVVSPQCLEEPGPRCVVAAEHMVVVAEPPCGQSAGTAWCRRQPTQDQRQAETEVTDPASAEGRAITGPDAGDYAGWGVGRGGRVEDVPELPRRVAYRHWLRADPARTAAPGPRN